MRGDERVAVPVAADPRPHAQERRQQAPAEGVAAEARGEVRIERRQPVEERVAVVRESVLDLVDDLQARQAQHRGLPEAEHAAGEAPFDVGALGVGERHAVALRHELRDPALRIEDAPALNFGRMRRQHRRQVRVRAPARDRVRSDAGTLERGERGLQAAALGRGTGERVHAATPVLVDVLGEIRELREVRERAHDVEHLRDRQAVEGPREFGARRLGLVARSAPEADGRLPDRFDARVTLLARLLAEDLAQDAAEQARVLAQRPVLVRIVDGGRRGEIFGHLRDGA